jgi:hypothetical protein
MEDLAARIGHMEKVVLPEQQAQPCLSVRKRVESMETFFVKRRPRDASRGSRAKLFAMFPDEGPYRREWYPRHMEFSRGGRGVSRAPLSWRATAPGRPKPALTN